MHNVFKTFFAFVVVVSAQAQNVPDANFAAAIRSECPSCIDANNNLLPSAAIQTHLDVGNSQISDLTGIEGFTSLMELRCQSNQLTSLPTMSNSILRLYCQNNRLTSLPTLPSNLLWLYCYGNQLTSLPTLPQNLERLSCYQNQLTSLPTLPQNLSTIECYSNQLMSLPPLPTNSLASLECYSNLLTSLPALPNTLYIVKCNDNQLTSLPTLSSSLVRLYCDNNAGLDCLPTLPNSLADLRTTGTNINCILNLPPSLVTTLPVCDTSNNSNGCVVVSILENESQANRFQIFPNPNKGSSSLRFAENVSLESANLYIYNCLGELVTQQKLQNTNPSITTNNLPVATYIVKVQAENTTFVQKMIIE